MKEFDLLLYSLQKIMKDNLYCEDNKLRIKTKCKYDLVNLMSEIDKKFMSNLYKELEYNEE